MPMTAIGTAGAAIASATPRHACATRGELGADGRAGRRCRADRVRRCARSGGASSGGARRADRRRRAARRPRRRARRRSIGACSASARSIASAPSSRSSTASSECDATVDRDDRVEELRVGRELVGELRVRLDEPVERGAPGDRVGRPLERPANGRAVDGRHRPSVARLERRLGTRHYPGPMPRLRVAAAQINAVVGDLDGNAERMLDAYEAAESAGAATSSCSPS